MHLNIVYRVTKYVYFWNAFYFNSLLLHNWSLILPPTRQPFCFWDSANLKPVIRWVVCLWWVWMQLWILHAHCTLHVCTLCSSLLSQSHLFRLSQYYHYFVIITDLFFLFICLSVQTLCLCRHRRSQKSCNWAGEVYKRAM